MTENPLVSIVIPVYNGCAYLREAIDSALAQTYGNCEVIAVNDGSTDNTEEICLGYGNKIRYFKKDNGGVSTALNFAVKRMRGEYFSWLSHDDMYYPHKIQTQINALTADGDVTKIVFGDYDKLYQDTGEKVTRSFDGPYDGEKLTDTVYPVLQSLLAGCSLLIHKSHFERIGGFNESLRYTQDYDLWFRMMRNRRHIYVNKPLYVSRVHPRQDSVVYSQNHRAEQKSMVTGFVDGTGEAEIKRLYGNRFMFLYSLWKTYNNIGPLDEYLSGELAFYSADVREAVSSIARNRNIYIFGAGKNGKDLYALFKLVGVACAGFIDNDGGRHGRVVPSGPLCVSPDSAASCADNIFCVITPDKSDGIAEQLTRAGIGGFISKRGLEEAFAGL